MCHLVLRTAGTPERRLGEKEGQPSSNGGGEVVADHRVGLPHG